MFSNKQDVSANHNGYLYYRKIEFFGCSDSTKHGMIWKEERTKNKANWE